MILRPRHLLVGLALGIVVGLPGAAPALAAGERTIAVVVDFGGGASSPKSFTACVKEPDGATDAQALADALSARAESVPSYASSGLLCSIAGYPTTGCGAPTASGYSYWAYFHGTSTGWTYAADGPGEHVAEPATAEGWRFELDGRGNPSDPAPSGQSDAASICAQSTDAVTSTTTPGTTTTTAPAVIGGPPTTTTAHTSTTARGGATTTTTAKRHAVSADSVAASTGTSTSGVATMVAMVLLLVLLVVGLVMRRRQR